MKSFLLITFCFCYVLVNSQDIIIKTNRKSISCNILAKEGDYVYFKLISDTLNLNYQIHLSDIYKIEYEDGFVETYNPEDKRLIKIIRQYYYPDILGSNIIAGSAGYVIGSPLLTGIVYEKQFSDKFMAFQLPVYYGHKGLLANYDQIKFLVDPTFILYPFGPYIYTLGISANIGLGQVIDMNYTGPNVIEEPRLIFNTGIGLVFQFNIRQFWVISLNTKILRTKYYRLDTYDAAPMGTINIGFRF